MAEATSTEPGSTEDAFLGEPPPFFSLAFHLRFLPRVIAWRLGEPRRQQHGFHPHVQMEIPLLLVAGVLLVVFGLPPALEHASPGGWLSVLLGAGGLTALVGWSIREERRWRREEGYRYGYAVLMPSVFFFCVLAGGSFGLIAGGVLSDEPMQGYLWAVPGLLAGYLVGPFAARWVHGLGIIKTWFVYLAVLGLILLPLEDLMVIFIYATKSN